MDSDRDPLYQFFPDAEEGSVDLYEVLLLKSTASAADIRTSYRKLALKYHPDKNSGGRTEFEQVGYAYAVLSDDKRRARYDSTGRTDEGLEGVAEQEGGWDAYFEAIFERVTREKMDEIKRTYCGSAEEKEDVKKAYVEEKGNLVKMLGRIMFSEEDRLVQLVESLISDGELERNKAWTKGVKDDKAREKRRKAGKKEAEEAEKMAKDLGVWEEFYGDGKARPKKPKGTAKGKGKGKADAEPDDGDEAALAAIIRKRKAARDDDLLASLEAKYAPKKKARKSKNDVPEPPELDDAEFERIQSRLGSRKK